MTFSGNVHCDITKHIIDKPQLKLKAKAKSKAKALAEVVYIITKCAVPVPSRPAKSIHSLNHKSD